MKTIHPIPSKILLRLALLLSSLLLTSLLLVGCVNPSDQAAPSPTPAQELESELKQAAPTETPEPTPVPPTETPLSPTETPLPEPTDIPAPALSGLLADPQRIEFQAADGKHLVGYYYPSKYAHAPVVILMHWAGGDQRDYCVLAPWLQNRQDEAPVEMPGCAEAPAAFTWGGPTAWWDPTWFPPMPEGSSLAVFTFDFRDFGESEAGMAARSEWAQDALAAIQTASNLDGVDPTHMVAAGASIGADGAVDGCLLYNQASGGGCLGGFSLSPGDYLEMSYPEVVTSLDTSDPAVPAWCLAGEYDTPAMEACQAASGDAYFSQIYLGREEHGMKLVDPRFEPTALDILLEFLGLTLGL
jgi:pimeloyl-ACP methyl ester carboxylesterase